MIYRLLDLGSKSDEEFVKEFDKISETATTLVLNRNELHTKSGELLAAGFKIIRPNITNVSLSFNNLYKMPAKELATALPALQGKIITLNLSKNNFGHGSGLDLGLILESIVQGELNLSENDLYALGDDLAEPLARMSKTIIAFDISGNFLFKMPGVQLAKALETMSPSVRILNLSSNDFDRMYGPDFAIALGAISKGVNYVNLSQNNLHQMPIQALGQGLKALTMNITDLNLSDNYLDKMANTNLSKLKGSAPYVRTLYLNQEEVEAMTSLQRKAIGDIFPNLEQVVLLDASGNALTNSENETNQTITLGFKTALAPLANLLGIYSSNALNSSTLNTEQLSAVKEESSLNIYS